MNTAPSTPARAIRLALLATVAAASPASAGNSPFAVFDAFGLLGTWSADCRLPPSGRNPRVRWYEAEDGRLMHTVTLNGRTFAVVDEVGSAWQVGRDLLQFTVVRGAQMFTTVLLQREGERIRPLRSEAPDGRVYVDRGTYIVNGKPTMAMQKCAAAAVS